MQKMEIRLQAEYVAVTEADLRLQVNPLPGKEPLEIRRGDSLIFRGALHTADTTVTDTGLLPAHHYTYTATLFQEGKPAAYSPPLQITTLDTTSHDFQWEIIEIPSPFGSGVLYDVAIVNEIDIWAVGEIYADSAQPWRRYNAVHWDGQQWELIRIPYMYNGQPWYHPMKLVFRFENGEVWFGGNGIVKWDGYSYSNVEINPSAWGNVAVNKAWGNSPNNVYIVGNNGTIARYDGRSWRRIESGTDLDIYDIWGLFNKSSGELEILCTGSKHLQDPEFRRVIFQIENNILTELSSHPIHWTLYSVWFVPERVYYVVGSGVYRKHSLTDKQ
ncbi:MAG: hypothetical protein Kow0042_14720 [Calditrichia bacterium]